MDSSFIHFTNSLQNTNCTLRYNERLKMLSVIWKGTASKQGITEVKDAVMEMIRKTGCQVLMNDIQDFFATSSEVLMDLAITKWDAESFRLGVKKIVHVVKPETDLEALQATHHDLPSGGVKFFDNKVNAIIWITEQQEK